MIWAGPKVGCERKSMERIEDRKNRKRIECVLNITPVQIGVESGITSFVMQNPTLNFFGFPVQIRKIRLQHDYVKSSNMIQYHFQKFIQFGGRSDWEAQIVVQKA